MSNSNIAKRYAYAFFSYINESHKSSADKIWQELSCISNLYYESDDFKNIIKNPTINSEEKIAIFSSLQKSHKLSDELFKFITLLIEKKRLIFLPDIDKFIKEFIMAEENKIEAEVTFAKEADSSIKNEIIKKLEKVTGKNIVLKEKIDPAVIGGVKVKFGSNLFDATIKGQLDKLKIALNS